jgi:hypothetical protein
VVVVGDVSRAGEVGWDGERELEMGGGDAEARDGS